MILIVDDKPENIYSLKALLTLHSFPVDTALSGEEALKKILAHNYALIILDVQMPGMDGFEVAESISGYSKSKDIPIIFLTAANTDKKYITRGYSSGGVDYITKPIDPDILLLKVKTLYRLYEQSRKLNEMHDNLVVEVEYRKKAERETSEKAAELRSILESIPQIAFTIRTDGTLEFTNHRWLEYSTSPGHFPPVHPEDIDIQEEVIKAIALQKPVELETRLKRIAGTDYRYHLLRLVPVLENDTIVKWAGTFTDIEDQKQASRRKDEFLSIASHELKTPLTSIKAYIQLLERESKDNSQYKPYVDRALTQVSKLNSLITDLLDISKIQSGKLEFNKKEFDFDAMLKSQLEMTKQNHPDYHLDHHGTTETLVYGDEIRLEQVITNFISNAIKYSPKEKKIVIETRADDQHVHFAVTDFGIGIPKDEQKNLFRKFYRAQGAAPHFQGMGLGLYICSEIIQRHDGSFGVNSEPGKGSTFHFTIPFKKQLS
ncbi:ATP-binding protein [Terrimonas sp. NA20]|uniref:histidine kinase n=1 Tax=Terrimonas ginsenosidimutans TaxID=2908004 RepID=A0ABS9KXZ7_9BACT|nr:ATP-binding protein [Terrimonas ginsenosidimutans]MCG2617178.1 ATP-binding protein [Terrimonas ginsenosidimutans]